MFPPKNNLLIILYMQADVIFNVMFPPKDNILNILSMKAAVVVNVYISLLVVG